MSSSSHLSVDDALEHFARFDKEEPQATMLGRFVFFINRQDGSTRVQSECDLSMRETNVPPYARECFDVATHRLIEFKGRDCEVQSFITGLDPTYTLLSREDQLLTLENFFEHVTSRIHHIFSARNYRLYGYSKQCVLDDVRNKKFTQPVAHVCGDIFGVNIIVIREDGHEWITDIESRLTVVLTDNTVDKIGVLLHTRNMWTDHGRVREMYAQRANYADVITFEKDLKKMKLKELEGVAHSMNIDVCLNGKRKRKKELFDDIMHIRTKL